MDWRLLAALAAAVGSFCFVAFGARVVLTTGSAPQQTFASAPMLPSEGLIPAAATPPLMGRQPPSPDGQSSPSPFAAPDDFTLLTAVVTSGAAVAPGRVDASAPPVNSPRATDKSLPGRSEPKQETSVGHKTAALAPNDDVLRPEPPARPAIEVKKSPVVPELQTALPISRYRGVLTSAEIFRIKRNLRLTPEQEPAWPAVEAALAEMGRQQVALIRHGQEPRISPNDWPPGRLYAVAGPLLQTLRPDQKETVRRVCRSLGFESVASML